uniref:Uncharacterized protein n=1 Tax=Cryptococcus bacillisporus CA1280 TaxID=1296109 RepID=A0A0D0UAA6_CRYGA|nr:hypothetical protein I312_05715 [Cryptococcus bacillisporus CA1280]
MSVDQANDHPSHLNHPLVYLLSGRSHPIKPWLHGPLYLLPFINLDLIPEKGEEETGVEAPRCEAMEDSDNAITLSPEGR